MTTETEVLAMAEALGWPAGVTAFDLCDDDKLIAVAGGEGGESTWREWVAAYTGDGVLTGVWVTLNDVHDRLAAGIDPGPPETWLEQAQEGTDALMDLGEYENACLKAARRTASDELKEVLLEAAREARACRLAQQQKPR